MRDLTQGTLLYAIDNWHQLANAKSNSDPTLKIRVTDFFNSAIFEGVRISIHHPQYGVLFACVVLDSGRLVSYDTSRLTTSQILTALRQFGFDVRYKNNVKLNNATRIYLQGALAAGYTHIRIATKKQQIVKSSKRPARTEQVVIAFNESKRPEYLIQNLKPICNFGGDVMVISPNNNPNLDFSWLEFPLYIESVLTDNL